MRTALPEKQIEKSSHASKTVHRDNFKPRDWFITQRGKFYSPMF